MIQLKIKYFIRIVYAAVIGFIALGTYAYFLIGRIDHMGLMEMVYFRQNIIFISVLISIFFLLGALFCIRKSRKLISELSDIAELAQMGSSDVNNRLKRLDLLGAVVYRIIRLYDEISSKKSMKITSMTGILASIMENITEPVIISDAVGDTVFVSNAFLSEYEFEKGFILQRSVSSILGNMDFNELYFKLQNKAAVIELPVKIMTAASEHKVTAKVKPVVNNLNVVSHIVFFLPEIS